MIRIAELTHVYRRPWQMRPTVRALDSLELEIDAGSAVGLIGLNGAGKTTLIRLLLGYLTPTSGRISIGGLSPRRYVEQHGIGYVPERVAVPRQWTVDQALRAYALLGNVGDDLPERIATTLREQGLEAFRRRRIAELSKGNLQRLAIGQAMLCDRKLLILDEPTDGLDPLGIAELRALIERWRKADPERVLVVASHHLPFLEQVVDRILVLHQGKLIAELTARQGTPLEESFLRLVREEGRAA